MRDRKLTRLFYQFKDPKESSFLHLIQNHPIQLFHMKAAAQ